MTNPKTRPKDQHPKEVYKEILKVLKNLNGHKIPPNEIGQKISYCSTVIKDNKLKNLKLKTKEIKKITNLLWYTEPKQDSGKFLLELLSRIFMNLANDDAFYIFAHETQFFDRHLNQVEFDYKYNYKYKHNSLEVSKSNNLNYRSIINRLQFIKFDISSLKKDVKNLTSNQKDFYRLYDLDAATENSHIDLIILRIWKLLDGNTRSSGLYSLHEIINAGRSSRINEKKSENFHKKILRRIHNALGNYLKNNPTSETMKAFYEKTCIIGAILSAIYDSLRNNEDIKYLISYRHKFIAHPEYLGVYPPKLYPEDIFDKIKRSIEAIEKSLQLIELALFTRSPISGEHLKYGEILNPKPIIKQMNSYYRSIAITILHNFKKGESAPIPCEVFNSLTQTRLSEILKKDQSELQEGYNPDIFMREPEFLDMTNFKFPRIRIQDEELFLEQIYPIIQNSLEPKLAPVKKENLELLYKNLNI